MVKFTIFTRFNKSGLKEVELKYTTLFILSFITCISMSTCSSSQQPSLNSLTNDDWIVALFTTKTFDGVDSIFTKNELLVIETSMKDKFVNDEWMSISTPFMSYVIRSKYYGSEIKKVKIQVQIPTDGEELIFDIAIDVVPDVGLIPCRKYLVSEYFWKEVTPSDYDVLSVCYNTNNTEFLDDSGLMSFISRYWSSCQNDKDIRTKLDSMENYCINQFPNEQLIRSHIRELRLLKPQGKLELDFKGQ